VLPSLRSLPQSWPVKDAKLGQCIVRSEFSEFSITALEKRLQAAADDGGRGSSFAARVWVWEYDGD
jgi:hypothetical protein